MGKHERDYEKEIVKNPKFAHLKMNTEDPLAPVEMQKKIIEDAVFPENYQKQSKSSD